jgi:hypothetical protein
VAHKSAGHFFGELALMSGDHKRTANVVAGAGGVQLLLIRREARQLRRTAPNGGHRAPGLLGHGRPARAWRPMARRPAAPRPASAQCAAWRGKGALLWVSPARISQV